MKWHLSVGNPNTPLILAVLALCVPTLAISGPSPDHGGSASNSGSSMTLHLGKIQVHGERDIYHVLQDIKVGLRQPYSTDPRLANVVVCRLVPKAGSHILEHLICGTNRALADQRFALQTGAMVAETDQPACDASCVMEHIFTKLNEYLQDQSVQALQATVNAAALRTVLQKIPDPNSAAEVMQLGPLTIHGQTDIMQTLQAIKLALQQPRSNDPKLAGVVVCRFQLPQNKSKNQMLECATNGTLSSQGAAANSVFALAKIGKPEAQSISDQSTVLNTLLTKTPGKRLQAKVDGPQLRALLKEISYPNPTQTVSPGQGKHFLR